MKNFRRRLARWAVSVGLSKRQQFVMVTLLLTGGLILTQVVPADFRYAMVALLTAVSYVAIAFTLREDLHGIEWVTVLVLPTLFTTGVSMFYFLLPVRWLTRLPIAGLYAVGLYALLLTENIYHVASNRSIALLRAAHSVGFLLTLITYFLLVSTVFSFRFPIILTIGATGIITYLLIFQSLWAIEFGEEASSRIVRFSFVLSAVFVELVWVFMFWPVKSVLVSLFLTTSYYSLVGMTQQYLAEKLYKKTVIEFFSVAAIVFVIVLFATRWRGNF